ncbi:hypothetical protein O181_129919 [Austropuccinia psidii MF-1]|uniref:Uncharacterized protein n=1 Tax=Austropuccinia psidii MF-1 TaxID=1389203 RepID=A0A9Q3L000_9BASI|nr:hypothetical protein [Austropuccinia psidii MF-1]
MVHTRNGSNHSVQQDGCGKRRGNTKSRSDKSSSRKTHLEDARVAPHSPRSAPTSFDVNSDSELIHHNISRAEPFSSGGNRNLSMLIQEWVQSSQRGGVGNMPKPLAGAHELLLTNQELSGSGEDHRALRRMEPIVLQRQDQKRELEMTLALEKEGPVASTSPIILQGQTQQNSEEAERSQEPSEQGQRQSKLAQTLPTSIQYPQIGALSHGQCLQYGQKYHGIHSQRAGKDEKDLSRKIIQEIQFVKTSIDVELGKFDAKFNKITSDISELKRNNKTSTEWYELTNVKLDSITNTCDRIESKCQIQEYEIGDISISEINEQLEDLKAPVLEIINNTNPFATHLEKK